MSSTQPNLIHMGWVRLGLVVYPCDGLGWVGSKFFLTHHGGLGRKIPLT